jgi:hypothetical protein
MARRSPRQRRAGHPVPPGPDRVGAGHAVHPVHEYDITDGTNVAAGEEVRWLPRRRASDLALPGNDFWLFDDRLVRFGYFTGDGEFLEHELADDPAVVKLCASAFEAVWERAIPHGNYRLVHGQCEPLDGSHTATPLGYAGTALTGHG